MSLPLAAAAAFFRPPAAAPARFPRWYQTWTRSTADEPSGELDYASLTPAYADDDNFYLLHWTANRFQAYSRSTGAAVPAANRSFTLSRSPDPRGLGAQRVYVDPAGNAWIIYQSSSSLSGSTYTIEYLPAGASTAQHYLDWPRRVWAVFRTADRFYVVETGSGGREFGRAYTYPGKVRAASDDVRLGLTNPQSIISTPPFAIYAPVESGNQRFWPYDTRIKAPSNAYRSTYAVLGLPGAGAGEAVLLIGDRLFIFGEGLGERLPGGMYRDTFSVRAFIGTNPAPGYGGGAA